MSGPQIFGVSVVIVFILLPIVYALVWSFDHHGWFGHEKDTWFPGPRAKRLQQSVDALGDRLERIERMLEEQRTR